MYGLIFKIFILENSFVEHLYDSFKKKKKPLNLNEHKTSHGALT